MHPKDVLRSEFIGSLIKVVDAENPELIGIEGKVIDESKHTFVVEEKQKRKVLLKTQVTIKWKGKTINGKKLVGRPEERLKK